MNLYQKIQQFLYWRKFNLTYWQIFKSPLTEGDKVFIGVIILMVMFAAAWAYDSNKKEELIAVQQQAQKNAVALRDARLLAKINYEWGKKYEDVIVSMYNGSFFENDRIKTVCILNAAGLCEE